MSSLCEKCGLDVSKFSKDDKNYHKKTHEENQECEVCGNFLKNTKILKQHVVKVHLNKETLECYQCKQVFKNSTKLNDHISAKQNKTFPMLRMRL